MQQRGRACDGIGRIWQLGYVNLFNEREFGAFFFTSTFVITWSTCLVVICSVSYTPLPSFVYSHGFSYSSSFVVCLFVCGNCEVRENCCWGLS